jgi:L-fuconolactonase
VIIDGHVHFWESARQEDILIVRQRPTLQQDFRPGDLQLLAQPHGVDKVILVEAAPNPEHTRWCLNIARDEAMVAGVVGWVDLEAADVRLRLSELKAEAKCAGVRAKVNRAPEPDWLRRPAVLEGFAAVSQADLVAELLVLSHQLPVCLEVCRALPGLRVVIDHGGQPDIQGNAFEPWASRITEIARTTTATCKISGLIELAGPGWNVERLKPFFGHLLESFGPRRLLFGSNWPVVNVAGDYHAWWDTLQRLLDDFRLAEAERAALLGSTAAGTYRLSY